MTRLRFIPIQLTRYILDAIDLCLGARRNAPFGDTDFYHLGQHWGHI